MDTETQPLDSDDRETLIDWSGDDDPENPFNWSLGRKWLATSVASVVAFIVGINSTALTAAASEINASFNVSDAQFPNSYWPVTSWNMAAAVVPMVLLPLMESFGIRKLYLWEYIIFTLFVIPQAVASNFATLIITRIFAGGLGGVLQNIGDAIIADTFEDEHARSLPITLLMFSYLGGVTFGPVFGGAVIAHLEWRWIFYIQLIIYIGFFPFVYFFLPETRAPIILKARAARINKSQSKPVKAARQPDMSLPKLFKEAVIRPLHLLCTEPSVFFMTLLSSFAFGLVFDATQSVAQVFPDTFNFSESQAGLVQASQLVGEFVGALACIAQNQLFWRSRKKNEENPGTPIPEARLPISILGSFIGLTGGLFFYGWTSGPEFHWFVPCIGLGFIGFGIMTVVHAVSTYLTDAYIPVAASAMAALALGENSFAAWLPLSTMAMYNDLGFHWASSALAFLALIMSFAPVILYLKGRQIRAKSNFAD